jgi:hypothetical protein
VLRAALVERAKASGLYGQRWQVETVFPVIKRKATEQVAHNFAVLMAYYW